MRSTLQDNANKTINSICTCVVQAATHRLTAKDYSEEEGKGGAGADVPAHAEGHVSILQQHRRAAS
eukprot:6208443-Pleurochrysis_carterae.AAC.3